LKISSHQVRAALDAYVKAKREDRRPEAADGEVERVQGLHDRLSELPEEREILVQDLRTKVRRGRYYVSSREIVDALLGRLTADLLRNE